MKIILYRSKKIIELLKYFFFISLEIFTIPLPAQTVSGIGNILIPYSCDGNKWGFVDKNKNLIIPCKYDRTHPFINGIARFSLNYKLGYIDSTGKEIVPADYDFVELLRERVFKVNVGGKLDYVTKKIIGGKWKLISINGEHLTPLKYDRIDDFKDGMALIAVNGKFGFIDNKGNEVVPPKYNEAKPFSEGLAGVRKGEKWAFIDKTGKPICGFIYDDVFPFRDGLAKVERNFKDSFIDKTGKEILPFVYSGISYFDNNGLAEVYLSLNNIRGIIDRTGRLLFSSSDYQSLNILSNGLITAKLNGKWILLDSSGKRVGSASYDNIYERDNGLSEVVTNDKHGMIDAYGKEVIPPIYDDIEDFSEELAIVKINGKYGFVDKSGNLVIPAVYETARSFSEGLAAVEQNGKFGYIDKTGKWIIKPIYDNAYYFSNGWANVFKDDYEGYIDKTGREIIPLKYSSVIFESDELAYVNFKELDYTDITGKKYYSEVGFYIDRFGNEYRRIETEKKLKTYERTESGFKGIYKIWTTENGLKRWGLIDESENVLLPLIYSEIQNYSEGLFAVKNSTGQFGYADTTGKIVIPFKYKDAGSFSFGLAKVYDYDHSVYINQRGETVIEPRNYEQVGDYYFGFLRFKKDGKWGLLDNKGNVYQQPIYDKLSDVNYYGIAIASFEGVDLLIRFDKEIIYTDNTQNTYIKSFVDGIITFETSIYQFGEFKTYTTERTFPAEQLSVHYYKAAYYLAENGKFQWAAGICSKVIDIAVDKMLKADAYHLRASCLSNLDKWEEAVQDIKRACELGSEEACKILNNN